MLRLQSSALLVIPLWLIPFLAYGQAPASSPAQNPPAVASPQPTAAQGNPTAVAVGVPIPADAPRMSRQTHFEIIRDFETQLVYARTTFPMGTKGLILKDGMLSPNGEDLRQALALWGPSVKPGDPAHISFVQIKDDHIHLEINGGAVRRKKWYQHLQVSGNSGVPIGAPDNQQTNVHGSYLDVYFDKYVPEMTAQQLRELLFPALDFNARNKEQAYLDAVPPKVKVAIQAHHVLVGMNTEMVLHAKGKPPKKVREHDGETEYEEWIYGEFPGDVDFVRIVNDAVVRVETMKVSGEKIVRTEREVVLPESEKEKDQDKEAKKEPEERPANPPTLRRPGESADDVPRSTDESTPVRPLPPQDPGPPDSRPTPGSPPPGTQPPPGIPGPGEAVGTR